MEFWAPFNELTQQLWALIPNLFAMVVILSVGIAISIVLRKLLVKLLRNWNFDDLAYKTGFAAVLFKANLHSAPISFVANLASGLVLLFSLMLALAALNLQATANMITGVMEFIPNLIVAAIVVGAGYLVSKFIGRSVLLTAVNAEVPGARLISYAVQTLIMLFAIAIALEQIGLAQTTIIAAFSILFGGLVLALSIAFGLGGRDLAREFLERRMRRPSDDSYVEKHPFQHL